MEGVSFNLSDNIWLDSGLLVFPMSASERDMIYLGRYCGEFAAFASESEELPENAVRNFSAGVKEWAESASWSRIRPVGKGNRLTAEIPISAPGFRLWEAFDRFTRDHIRQIGESVEGIYADPEDSDRGSFDRVMIECHDVGDFVNKMDGFKGSNEERTVAEIERLFLSSGFVRDYISINSDESEEGYCRLFTNLDERENWEVAILKEKDEEWTIRYGFGGVEKGDEFQQIGEVSFPAPGLAPEKVFSDPQWWQKKPSDAVEAVLNAFESHGERENRLFLESLAQEANENRKRVEFIVARDGVAVENKGGLKL